MGACNILNRLITDFFNFYETLPSDSFLNDQDYLNQIYKFAEKFSNGIKNNTQEMRQSFEKLAEQFMIISRQFNIQQREDDKNWLVYLVLQLEAACGKEKALDFAERHESKK